MPTFSQDNSQFSQRTQEYFQQLQNIKEEQQVLDLLEPQYEYPETDQVYHPTVYLDRNGKPYNFEKRISKATKFTLIDITDCPPETLAYLLDLFPESDISFSRTNLIIPYVPVLESLKRAYEVLPIDTVAEYRSI